MKILNNFYSNSIPKKVTVYPTSVYVCESYEQVSFTIKRKDDSGEVRTFVESAYKCQMLVYEIPEYIEKLHKENETLSAQTTELQLALCEVYEMML